jgi:DNA-binding response OmpR family regulator
MQPTLCTVDDPPTSNRPITCAAVLWIDDDLDQASATVQLLLVSGFHVDVARSAAAGIALATQNKYGLILLDLRLPDLSGIDCFRALRSLKVEPPVVVVTGFGTIATAVVLMRLGAHDILEKPMIGEQLVSTIRHYMTTAAASRDVLGASVTASKDICWQIARVVLSRPQISLAQTARVVGIERHVVERMVRAETGAPTESGVGSW